MKKLIIIMTFTFAMTAAVRCIGQGFQLPVSTKSAAAKAEFEKGFAMPFGGKDALAQYRKAMDIDPDFYEAHQYYILALNSMASQSGTDEEKKAARDKAHKELDELYQGWAKEHPDKPVYRVALGWVWDYDDPDRAVRYYKEAVALDPKCAPAYGMLSVSAEEKGNLKLSREYARQAHEAWPSDSKYWLSYIGRSTVAGDADLKKATELTLQLAEKFPEEGARYLGYVASRSRDERQRREIYETLRQKLSKVAKGYTLVPLFNIYLKTDRAKALGLAEEMVKNDPANKQWTLLKEYAQTVIQAETVIGQGNAADAIVALDKVKLGQNDERSVLDLTRARALDASGQTAKAYGDLASTFAKTPSDAAYAALIEYGKKLGKDTKQIDADIWAQRSANAKEGIPFSLVNYATGKPVSLDDYKGRVVLVNFWYPKCGPCRGEFPYMQASLEKYKKQGFEILAINGHAPEGEWVMPLIKGWKLGFIPLKGTEEIIKAYNVRGFPSNFLYGPDGRIYPMPSFVRPATLREFELQVEALLAQAKLMKHGQ